MNRFHVGQMVQVVLVVSPAWGKRYIGKVATVTEVHWGEWYNLDIAPPTSVLEVSFHETCLRPINDGEQPSTWEECVWKPKDLEVTPDFSEGEMTITEPEAADES